MSEDDINNFFVNYINENGSNETTSYPKSVGGNIICPKCHHDTGYPMVTCEVVYADKHCPFCGSVVVHAMNIMC